MMTRLWLVLSTALLSVALLAVSLALVSAEEDEGGMLTQFDPAAWGGDHVGKPDRGSDILKIQILHIYPVNKGRIQRYMSGIDSSEIQHDLSVSEIYGYVKYNRFY